MNNQQSAQLKQLQQEKKEYQEILEFIFSITFQDYTNQILLGRFNIKSEIKKDIMQVTDKLQICKQKLLKHKYQTDFMNKLVNLRDQQIEAIIQYYNTIQGGGHLSIVRILQLFYIKEVKLYEKYPATLKYLTNLSQKIYQFQQELYNTGHFLSSITLDYELVNKLEREEIFQVKTIIHKEPEQLDLQKLFNKQQEYLKTLSERNRMIKRMTDKIQLEKDKSIKAEFDNKIDRVVNQIKQAHFKEQKQQEQQTQKVAQESDQSSKCIHKDLMGQMIWLLQDQKYKLWTSEIDTVYGILMPYVGKIIYKNGLLKNIEYDKFKELSHKAILMIERLSQSLKQFYYDELTKIYLKEVDISQYLKKLKEIDFIHFALNKGEIFLQIRMTYKEQNINQSILILQESCQCDSSLDDLKRFFLNWQKHFELIYDEAQKKSDQILLYKDEWKSKLLKCSQKKIDKFSHLIKSVNHCCFLHYELSRVLLYKWSKHFFQKKQFQLYKEKSIREDAEDLVMGILKNKIKYFPNLIEYLINQTIPLQEYLKSKFTNSYLKLIHFQMILQIQDIDFQKTMPNFLQIYPEYTEFVGNYKIFRRTIFFDLKDILEKDNKELVDELQRYLTRNNNPFLD